MGLFYGVVAGYGLLIVVLLVLVARTDWQQQIKDASMRST